MDTIALARELGRAIQQEESYINLKNVQAQADADADLQKLIGEFNTKRMGINEEASKKDRDQQKLTTLNREMREVYSKIMSNENMIAYNEAKEAFDKISNKKVVEGIGRLAEAVNNSAAMDDVFAEPYLFPRWLYLAIANA